MEIISKYVLSDTCCSLLTFRQIEIWSAPVHDYISIFACDVALTEFN